jgi:hypothetical protein
MTSVAGGPGQGGSVLDYRLYYFSPTGEMSYGVDLQFEDDYAAMEAMESRSKESTMELWRLRRMVWRFSHLERLTG